VHNDGSLRLQDGIQLFNNGRFFECHEVLEAEWTLQHGPRRLFLQSLIHVAVGLYHAQRNNSVGATRQLRKGLRKLAAYLPSCEGIDTERLHTDVYVALQHIEEAEAFSCPQIHTR
jgi:uncharacterized protein